MPRPKNKSELQQLSDANFEKLLLQVKQLREEKGEFEFPKGSLNRNIKDVLAHVHEWHKMMLGWYDVGKTGEKPDMPKKGYTWKTLPDLNREIWKKYKDDEYEKILKKLKGSHKKVRKLIDMHTNEELFTKKKYNWTGSTSLAAYLISNTSSHYDWAFKLIKKSSK